MIFRLFSKEKPTLGNIQCRLLNFRHLSILSNSSSWSFAEYLINLHGADWSLYLAARF